MKNLEEVFSKYATMKPEALEVNDATRAELRASIAYGEMMTSKYEAEEAYSSMKLSKGETIGTGIDAKRTAETFRGATHYIKKLLKYAEDAKEVNSWSTSSIWRRVGITPESDTRATK